MSTYTYSNPATSYLTQTNSLGVVTGMPTNPAATGAVTSQPPVSTIPAGEPTGLNTLSQNVSGTLHSFTISVGSSTTMVLSGAGVATSSSGGAGGSHHTKGSNGGGSQASAAGGSSTQSASASSSGNAAVSNANVASAGLIGLGALFAALL